MPLPLKDSLRPERDVAKRQREDKVALRSNDGEGEDADKREELGGN